MHGDAAFCGEGVVYETINLANLPDYHNGGTIHFVINNQVGFTTDPAYSRSSLYCTGISTYCNLKNIKKYYLIYVLRRG